MKAKASDVFRDAYQERQSVAGLRSFRFVPRVWMNVSAIITIITLSWALGVLLDLAWLWMGSVAALCIHAVLNWHVLRSLRLALFNAAIIVGMTAFGALSAYIT